MMHRAAVVALTIAATILLSSCGSSGAQTSTSATLFTEVDLVQAFDVITGAGFQVGTTTGTISGTSFVKFQMTITGPPGTSGAAPVSFQNKVTFTDIDGDQIFFDNNGTGSFHLGVPGDAFMGTGGPMAGTYVVTGGTGKYKSWTVGSVFQYHAIFANPSNGALGNVYAQIHS